MLWTVEWGVFCDGVGDGDDNFDAAEQPEAVEIPTPALLLLLTRATCSIFLKSS